MLEAMKSLGGQKRGLKAAWIALFALALAVISLLYFVFVDGRLQRPYRDSFQRGDTSEWKFYGGSWTVNQGVLDNLSGVRGDKAVTGSVRWTDYEIETDLRLNADPADSMWGDAGVVLRVTDPSFGVDSYDGYYAGIGSEGDVLLFGRANYSWNRLSLTTLGVPARRGAWFHLTLLAKGCYFEATARDLASGSEARLTYFDHNCSKLSGAAGVRSFGLPASWRNFTVHKPPQ